MYWLDIPRIYYSEMSSKRKRMDGPPGISKKPKMKRKSGLSQRRAKLRSMLAKPQLKYYDINFSNTEVNYDSIVNQLLNGLSVGDTDTTRDGQTIVMNSVQVKGLITQASAL